MASVPVADLLARRADLLQALRDEPRSKTELANALSVSRSTVDRAIRNLESRGFVERGQSVSLTIYGRLALDAYEEFTASIDALDEGEDALAPLSADATLDDVLFRGAEVVVPDPIAPQRGIERYLELVADATRVRGFSTALLDSTVPTFRERILEHDLQVELVVDSDVLEALVSIHDDTVVETTGSGNLTLLEATTQLEYNLSVIEQHDQTHACGLFYTPEGDVALVRSDDPDAVAWAESVYATLREDAEPLND